MQILFPCISSLSNKLLLYQTYCQPGDPSHYNRGYSPQAGIKKPGDNPALLPLQDLNLRPSD